MTLSVRRLAFPLLAATIVAITLVACGSDNSSAPTDSEGQTDSGTTDTGQGGADTGQGGTDTGGGADGGETADNARPNILFIITDDQGLDASAQYSYSQDLPNTPVLDQLAADGLVFDNMWATPSCTTTRGSVLTGQHGVNSGVDTTPSLLDTSTLTVQRHLGDSAGYQTAVFGKWHVAGAGDNLPNHPNDVGVDHYAGNIAGTLDDYNNWPLTINGVQQTSSTYHTTAITDMAIDWIAAQQGPWFSWVAYVAPHSPFHLPPADLHNRSLSGTDEDIASNSRPYFLAAIEAMDTEIGRLLDSLDPDQRANTLVMVLGDNGTPRAVIDTAAFPRAHAKNSLYEGGIRVPFVVSGAMVSSDNVRETALVNTVDILPTLSQAAGIDVPSQIDGISFFPLLQGNDEDTRRYNYSEFIGDLANGWTVRDIDFKLIELADGTREFYDLRSDIREESNLIDQSEDFSEQIAQLDAFARAIRGSEAPPDTGGSDPIDLTDAILTNTSANCADYAASYDSQVLDVNNNQSFSGSLQIEVGGDSCTFVTNAIPNHNLNDGSASFPNAVAAQSDQYTVTASPLFAVSTTPLSLTMDDAILLNGVKVDILAAGCFGVGNGRVGCNDPQQPWRYDPMFAANGFRVDSHNAHTQSDGTYHYHGAPNALFEDNPSAPSPVVGFAADGFPIFGSYFDDGTGVRKAVSSYRLKAASRPDSEGNPGGVPDGSFRDDYEYVAGLGDLDECNGMMVNGVYGYYMIDAYPWVLSCFKGTPDPSFFK
jgi:arylsulfatase A-like enzyme